MARVKGILIEGDVILEYRYSSGTFIPPGREFRRIIAPAQRRLLETVRDHRTLKWDGTAVVRRTVAERRAIRQADIAAAAARSASSAASSALRELLNRRLRSIGQPEITSQEAAQELQAALEAEGGL